MTRPATCQAAGGEPCQCMCMDECALGGRSLVKTKTHDAQHPLVRTLKGCGHGVLFSDYCRDCEIVGLQDQYKQAIKTVMRVRNRLRALGEPLPGMTSLPTTQAKPQGGE